MMRPPPASVILILLQRRYTPRNSITSTGRIPCEEKDARTQEHVASHVCVNAHPYCPGGGRDS